jgi:hypothetical protein
VLLIVLWVRSYWRIDALFGLGSARQYFAVGSEDGVVSVTGNPNLLSLFSATNWQLQDFLPGPKPAPSRILGFHYKTSQRQGTRLRLPIWFLVIIAATAATAPWIRRFSLRTLLIATTLVAVVLGLIVAVLRWPAG